MTNQVMTYNKQQATKTETENERNRSKKTGRANRGQNNGFLDNSDVDPQSNNRKCPQSCL